MNISMDNSRKPKGIFFTRHSTLVTRRSLQIFSFSLLLYFVGSLPLLSEHTRRWRQSTYEEFLKGTAHGVAVRSDGRLELAPKFTLLADADASYLWSVRLDPKGTLYAATGDKGQLFAVTPEGKGELFYSSDEAHIRVLAFDSKNNLIAGTEPSGRILRISRTSTKISGKNSKDSSTAATEGFVLYETSKREVTSLAVSSDGPVYASTIDA